MTPAQTIRAGVVAMAVLALATPLRAGDIMQELAKAGNFGRFLLAIERAGMESTLRGPGPFTLFAPVDGSFVEMEDGGGYTILLVQTERLRQIVGYHIVPQIVSRAAMQEGSALPTLQGKEVIVMLAGGTEINGQPLRSREIVADNGIIQPIDALLRPPGF